GRKLIKESSRKSGKKTNDLVVFNKHGDPCVNEQPDDEIEEDDIIECKERLRKFVEFLEELSSEKTTNEVRKINYIEFYKLVSKLGKLALLDVG
ncbi:8609_t:CDS:2, partial [Entrophospora sp. SA101]